MTHQHVQTIRKNEAGMVSIMVTMILMIVISLLVLGFAQISRRNQRQSLDRQLSTQAFYAAESGVNDALNRINTANGATIPEKKTCADTGGGFYAGLNSTIDGAHRVSYSCLLVDPSPKQLSFNSTNETGTVIPLLSGSGANFSSLKLEFKTTLDNTTPKNGCPTSVNAQFTPRPDWSCGYGIARIDLVPVAGNVNAGTLQSTVHTIFAVPFSSGGTTIYNYANAADKYKVFGMSCDNTSCVLNIQGLSSNQYYMRVTSLYQANALTVTGTDASGGAATFNGAQIVIDATGKAQDVLRRIQVHAPANGSGSKNQLPNNALQSNDSICKRFSVMENFFENSVSSEGNNVLCQN